MIKNLEEYNKCSAKLLKRSITPEESAKIKKELEVFHEKNPKMFEEFRRKKMAPSLEELGLK